MFERNGLKNLKDALCVLQKKGCIDSFKNLYNFKDGQVELNGEEVIFTFESFSLPMFGGQIKTIEGISDSKIKITFRTATGTNGCIILEVKNKNHYVSFFYLGDDEA